MRILEVSNLKGLFFLLYIGMTKIISFGYRCSSASLIQLLGLKTESYPFDWMVSKLDSIMKCIESDFEDFCNVDNYEYIQSETSNVIDGTKRLICHEHTLVNMAYETRPINNSTYGFQIALNHKNMKSDLDYYQRCILRLKELLKSDMKKVFIHFYPVLGSKEFNDHSKSILEEFNEFNSYIQKKTSNIFGLYFITVISKNDKKSDMIESSNVHSVYVIYCNEGFVDGGPPFMGNCKTEMDEMAHIIKMYV
jgi:hypothetical protein